MQRKNLILECQKQIQCIRFKHISHLHYQDGAISIHLTGDKRVLHCVGLKELEARLPENFVRINRNIIINLNYLSAYYKASQKVVLESGHEFDVSRRNVGALLQKIVPAV